MNSQVLSNTINDNSLSFIPTGLKDDLKKIFVNVQGHKYKE
tara:strand:- start:264 stop:386 length:123 start_codon:yes stop_codon:yes gene_type:complete